MSLLYRFKQLLWEGGRAPLSRFRPPFRGYA
nr:MAG TPA: hypothetical protein [Caudoviricetes sp.]